MLIIVGRHRPDPFRSVLGCCLGLATITGLADLMVGSAGTRHLSTTKGAGGLVGLGVARPLQLGLGTAGAVVVLVALLVVAGVITTGVSIGTVVRAIGAGVTWVARAVAMAWEQLIGGELREPADGDADDGWDELGEADDAGAGLGGDLEPDGEEDLEEVEDLDDDVEGETTEVDEELDDGEEEEIDEPVLCRRRSPGGSGGCPRPCPQGT